jgi:hypothetical protein
MKTLAPICLCVPCLRRQAARMQVPLEELGD